MVYIGIDIGGTNIKGAILDCERNILLSRQIPTQAQCGFETVRGNIVKIISELKDNAKDVISAVAVSSAGDIDPYSGKVVYATDNLPGYSGFDICGFISNEFGLPSVAINDGHAALLGEMTDGALKKSGFSRPAMLTFGTGVGGAYAQNGGVVFGDEFRAGRFGHYTLFEGGKACGCGKSGCAEQYLSANALVKSAGKNNLKDFFAGGYIEPLTVFIDNLARLLDIIYIRHSPDAFVLGGGLVYFADLWLEMLKNKTPVTVLPALLKNDAGIIGAVKWAQTRLFM